MKFKIILLIVFLYSFLIIKTNNGKVYESQYNTENKFVKVHSLKKKDSTLIGEIYVRFINDSVFTDLHVINNLDTINSIKNNVFLNAEGKDIEVFKENFYGYMFIKKGMDYFTLSYLRNKGKNVSDDIRIIWNYEYNILENEKIP